MSQSVIDAIRIQQNVLQEKISFLEDQIETNINDSISAREELEQLVREREEEIANSFPTDDLVEERSILSQAWQHLEDSVITLLQKQEEELEMLKGLEE